MIRERYRLTGLQTVSYTVHLVLHPHNYLIPIAELPCYPLLSLDAVLPVCAWFPYSLHSNSDTHREYENVVQTIRR